VLRDVTGRDRQGRHHGDAARRGRLALLLRPPRPARPVDPAGVVVEAGARLGLSGNTGNARTTEPHLHFGISKTGSVAGEINPYPYLRPVGGTPCAASPEPRSWLQVVVPRDNHSAPFTAEQLYAALHAATGRRQWTEVALVGAPRHVGIYLRAEASRIAPLRALVRATYPDAEVVAADPPLPHAPAAVVGARWRLREHAAYPIKTVREFENSEPMAMTLGALAEATAGDEYGLVHLALAPAPARFHRDAKALALALARGEVPQPLWLRALNVPLDLVETAVTSLLTTSTEPANAAPMTVVHADLDAQLKWVNGKAAQAAFTVTLRTAWAAPTATRAAEGHAALVAALGQFAVPGQNALEPARRLTLTDWPELLTGDVARRERIVLGTAELAGLCHLPGPDLVVPHLARTGARRREQRLAATPDTLVLAETTHRDRREPVGVRVHDLMTHAYVVGPVRHRQDHDARPARPRARRAEHGGRRARPARRPHPPRPCRATRRRRGPGAAVRHHRPGRAADDQPAVAAACRRTRVLPRLPALCAAPRSPRCSPTCGDCDRAMAPNLMHFLEAALAALVATGDGCLAQLPRFLTDGGVPRRRRPAALTTRASRAVAEFAALGPDDRSRTVRAILNKAADFDRNPILATDLRRPRTRPTLDEVMDTAGCCS
jgi:hypothetical protein